MAMSNRGHNGGVWGWVQRGVLRKELEASAFALKPGDLSPVIETKEDFYIMRVTGHRPGALKQLEQGVR